VEAMLLHLLALSEKHFNEKFMGDGKDSLKLDESRKNRRRVKSIDMGAIESAQSRRMRAKVA
jgi:hypothetical protein